METASNSLGRLIREALSRPGDGCAIEFEGREYPWSFARRVAVDVAAALERMGIAEDERVGLVARTRPSHIAALWGILAAGRCASMVYSAQSAAKLASDLRALRFPLVLADRQDWTAEVREAASASGAAGLMLTPDGIEAVPGLEAPGPAAQRDSLTGTAIETLSSGTTGRPKRIALTKQNVEGSVRSGMAALEQLFSFGDRPMAPIIMMLPLGNMSGIYGVLPPLVKGHPMAVMEKFELEPFLELLGRHRPPTADIPPPVLARLVHGGVPKDLLSSLRVVRSGASPLDRSVQQALLDEYGIPVALSYGASEFCGVVSTWSGDDLARHARSKLGSSGRAVPGAQLRIVDPGSFESLPPGEVGLLEARVQRIGDRWIRTTDLCRIDEEGFLWFEGRADGAIMRGGFKILPEQIAEVLRRHEAVADAAVVGLPDAELGEVPVAAIELRPGGAAPPQESWKDFARLYLAAWQVPVRFLIVPRIPRTTSLKISLAEVRGLFEAGSDSDQESG